MDKYFIVSAQWRVAICIQCQHAVGPENVVGHLTGHHHRLSRTKADIIKQELAQHPNVSTIASFEPISGLDEPIPGLKIHNNAFMCAIDPACTYTAMSLNTMKQHSSHQHLGTRKRSSTENTGTAWVSLRRCQQMFTSGSHSNYFRVDPISSITNEAKGNTTPVDAIAEAKEQARAAQKALTDRTVQEVQNRQEGTEIQPWLEKMGWPTYLQGLNRPKLMNLVKTPDVDEEPFAVIVWDAMEDMLRRAQQTVKERAGYYLRMEVVRSEAQQHKYRPLQAYMDSYAFKDYARPWKQIVTFFVRTQTHEQQEEHQLPQYRFDEKERTCFEAMVQQARHLRNQQKNNPGVQGPDPSEPSSQHSNGDPNDPGPSPASSGMLEGLELTCLRFCLALLERRTRCHEYELPMLCAMAVLAVKPQGWRNVHEYPPIMSHIIKMARFMIIQAAFQDSVASQQPGTEEGPDLLRYVTRLVDQCMIRGSHGAMQWIFDRRAYGMKIHYTSTSAGNVDWAGDQIRYKKIELGMNQLRDMVHGLTCRTYRALELVLGVESTEFPSIPWLSLRDDPTREGIGHNFTQDDRNPWPVDASMWLLDGLIDRRAFQQRGDMMNRHKMHEWCQSVDRFHGMLATLVQWVWGQNARGPEFLSMCGWSSGEGQGHNMFIASGYGSDEPQGSQVELVTRYHKGYNISGTTKVIHRFLPREVGALLIWAVWLVRPAWDTLQSMRAPGQHGRDWKIWHADAGGRAWTPARISREMKQASEEACGEGLTIQSWRDISIAVSRKYLRKGQGRFHPDEEDWDNEKDADEVEDMQAGHGTHVAGIVYARGIREQDGAVESTRQKFRRASENWHRFLGFVLPEVGTSDGGKRKRVADGSNATTDRPKRLKRLKSLDLDLELQSMMRDQHATFRASQRNVLRAIMRAREPVLAIMPTGAGKSLLFMLPAFCGPGGITVVGRSVSARLQGLTVTQVVVPLIALRQDLQRRCHQAGIPCREWNPHSPPDDARLVLTTPESALGEDFACFLNRIRGQGRLDRIVIDECHVVLNDQPDFRPCLQQLGRLNQAQAPMVMLTTTLPPLDEDRFLERMWFNRSDVRLFRSPTTRKNIRYRTYRLRAWSSSTQEQELLAMIHAIRAQLLENEKMIVYSKWAKDCQTLAESIGCEAYFHDAEDKNGIYRRFATEPRSHIIVATNAFGLGVDVPHVRCVIHMNEPRSLLEYGQESGRAGRDGHPSQAIMVLDRVKGRDHENGAVEPHLLKWMESDRDRSCKRVILDRYFDGRKNRIECEPDEEPCEECEGKNARGEGDAETPMDSSEPLVMSHETPFTSSAINASDPVFSPVKVKAAGARYPPTSHELPTSAPHAKEDPIRSSSPLAATAQPSTGSTTPRSATGPAVARASHGASQPVGAGIVARHQQQVQQTQARVRQLKAACDAVRGRCAYCYLTAQPQGTDHFMFRCDQEQCGPIRRDCYAQKKQVRANKELAPYAGCTVCFLPQAWCNRWRERTGAGNAGSYRLVPEERLCDYQDVMMEMLFVLLHINPDFRQQMQSRMPAGLGWPNVTSYWGQRVQWGGMETYRMVVEVSEGLQLQSQQLQGQQ